MTLPTARLVRLEQARRGPDLDVIWQRCEAGTASIGEMAMALGDAPDRLLNEGLVPHATLAIDIRRSGDRVHRLDVLVSTYPPGEVLPEQLQIQLDYLRWTATYTQQDLKRRVLGYATRHLLNPEVRMHAATVLLAIGDQGQRARSAVWEPTQDGWVPSTAAVVGACEGIGPCCGETDSHWTLLPQHLLVV